MEYKLSPTNLNELIKVTGPSEFCFLLNLSLPRAFAFLKRFSVYIRPVSFCDSIFKAIINSAAVLKHPWLKFTGNVIVMLPFSFVDLQRLKFGVSTIFGKFIAIFHL